MAGRPAGEGSAGERERRERLAELKKRKAAARAKDPCIRAENEDDDGYDPYSDRRPEREPLFQRDPWS